MEETGVRIEELIAQLETDDPRERRRVSREVLAFGEEARPALLAALRSRRPAVRKAAAYLLGHGRVDAEVVAALALALEDAEPKVRQNAAVSLGRLQAIEGAELLARALSRENVGYVRPSMILALGAIGGEAARAALEAVSPASAAEQEALHKVLDRCAPRRVAVAWRRDVAWRHETVLEVPVCLEAIALEELAERGWQGVRPDGPGRLRVPPSAPPWELLPAARCAYGLRVPVGLGRPLSLDAPKESARRIAVMVAESHPLRAWRDWLRSEEETIPFRFTLEGADLRPAARRVLVAAAREACRPLGWVDSPSNYAVELIVVVGPAAASLEVRPHFDPDLRFAYRKRHVGAALHPAVAACLARLARTKPEATVFDPTCGSGTLLIERAFLGARRLIGLDISPTAVAAARANLRAAGLADRVRIVRGDAADAAHWPRCDEVIANLPFGIRTRRAELDPARLYGAIVAQTAARLRPGGRAVLYTANRTALEPALAAHRDRLEVADILRVRAGGLWVWVWVLTPRPASA